MFPKNGASVADAGAVGAGKTAVGVLAGMEGEADTTGIEGAGVAAGFTVEGAVGAQAANKTTTAPSSSKGRQCRCLLT